MSVTLYVPRDAVALGLGANKVARALFAGAERRGLDVTIVRTGSRGLFWLEPMVEVATPEGRVAYGPVTLKDIDALLDGGLPTGGEHALRLELATPLTELLEAVREGGRLTVCTQCAQRRGLVAADLLAGVAVAGAASFVEEALGDGVQALVY